VKEIEKEDATLLAISRLARINPVGVDVNGFGEGVDLGLEVLRADTALNEAHLSLPVPEIHHMSSINEPSSMD